MEHLKSNLRDDLCLRFTNELQTAMSEWKPPKEISSNSAAITEDNLNEENMEVDDEQEDKQKKQSIALSEYNDVDYRFLSQDMDHRTMSTSVPSNDFQNEQRNDITRISPFSSVLPGHYDADDRTLKSSSIGEQKQKRSTIIDNDSDFRLNDVPRASPK